MRGHVRTRLQTLREHLHAKQQSQRSGSGAASIKTDRENNGSGEVGHA